jgi:hypothetical protein
MAFSRDFPYLEEERLSIMNEPQVEGRWEAPRPGAASTPAPALETVVSPPAFKTLTALLERLQALWARPRGATDRGGDDSPSRYEESSSCTSQSMCVAIPHDSEGDEPIQVEETEETKQRERMQSAMMCVCEVEDGPVSFWPRRDDQGEVE